MTKNLWAALIALMLIAPPASAQQGLFAIFAQNPERAAERAERRAARLAERAERKAARQAARQKDQSLEGGVARQDVKARVHYATMNRPKGRLWCVPFARAVSGLSLRGNAKTWWAAAQGKYERTSQPKVGAVMSFAASRAMPLGHVAVVSKVIGPREVLLDHANWDRNRITVDQLAVDVSKNNDWSKVRVANRNGTLGRINPVNGFIVK